MANEEKGPDWEADFKACEARLNASRLQLDLCKRQADLLYTLAGELLAEFAELADRAGLEEEMARVDEYQERLNVIATRP